MTGKTRTRSYSNRELYFSRLLVTDPPDRLESSWISFPAIIKPQSSARLSSNPLRQAADQAAGEITGAIPSPRGVAAVRIDSMLETGVADKCRMISTWNKPASMEAE